MSQNPEKYFPIPFLQRMQQRLGREFDAFLKSLQEAPPTSVRINPWKGANLFSDEEQVHWCKYGHYLPERPAFVWDPLYHAGCYYAQEASSMVFSNAIDFNRDLRILDLCAAPGGKSSLLLSFMGPGSILVSNELVGKRVNILYENLAKWGNTNSVVTCNRTSDFGRLGGLFDVVLVDAPCSGEGMFRKDEGAVTQWTEGLVTQCAAIQKTILADAYNALAPGGTLIYSTCTFEPQENEENIQWLYEQYTGTLAPAEILVKPDWNLWPVEIPVKANAAQMGYYCFPHRVKGEGLFVTALKKNASPLTSLPAGEGKRGSPRGKIKEASREQVNAIAPFCAFSKGYRVVDFDGAIQVVREEHLPFLDLISQNLYVRKLGTKCGILKGANLIPDHELAMSPLVAESIPGIGVDLTTALQYQQRNAIPVSSGTPAGWIMIRYKDTNIGWAKNVGSRLNNHYPAEWRIRKDMREFEAGER
jgi:16S rRNA C967 or C1407 C5-methylase (RsmB/RsmF family)/NOL1/NOP2/fmu family ribosome biogenesis protein